MEKWLRAEWLRAGQAGFAGGYSYLTVHNALRGRWWWVALDAAIVVLNVGSLVWSYRVRRRIRHGQFGARHVRMWPEGSRRLPIREDTVPILARKVGLLVWDEEHGLHLRPTNLRFGPVAMHALAVCHAHEPRPPQHPAPQADCSCGFYARPPGMVVTESIDQVVLDVELSGRVIVHEHGYRAQHQRVLQITVVAGCAMRGCTRRASMVVAPSRPVIAEAAIAGVTCDRCAEAFVNRYSFAELSEQFGVPVVRFRHE